MGAFDDMGDFEMTTFDDELNEAVAERETNPNTETVEVLVGKKLRTLKFTELDPAKWANIIAVHPPREGAVVDRYVNYDYHSIVKDVAPLSCVLVEGDVESVVTPEQWEKIFKVVSPGGYITMADAAWKLNALDPAERLEQAKKASVAPVASKKK